MRVFTGLQPSGQLHLGNYFGTICPLIELTEKSEKTYCSIVDLHALTTVQNPDDLRKFRQEASLDLLAAGFDAEKHVLFFQSYVPEHSELLWILSTVSPMGLLERAVSYKEKVEKGIPASVGLFTYPVLMAADILLYQADAVPVGKDQKQHLEMARDIAIKFNNAFGETFVVPESMIRDEVAVVPGTDGEKMSKSYGNTIPLFGSDAAVKKAIMGIKTDSKGMNDPKDPETCIIYQIHKLFLSASERKALAAEYKNGLPYGEAKKKLLATYMDAFVEMRKRRVHLEKNLGDVVELMQKGAARAKRVAEETMENVRKATGLR